MSWNANTSRWAFVIILVLFLTLATLYNAIIPVYESPDELQHAAFVAWLADGRGLPVVDAEPCIGVVAPAAVLLDRVGHA